MRKIVAFFLRILPFFKNEVDEMQVLHIVRLKYLMDNRKQSYNGKRESNYTLWLQYLLYLFFGGIAALVIGLGAVPFTSFFIAFTFFIFMLCIHLIADFSTVILDTRDNTIILPRPVSEKTYLFARVIHISLYVLGFAISFSIISVITILIKYGPLSSVIFLMNVLLSAVFSVFTTHLMYLGLMKIVSGERFKDIISYFQIVVTIIFFGGYQFLIQGIKNIKDFDFGNGNWWMCLLPPSWMAGSNSAFVNHDFGPFNAVNIALSVIVPIVGLFLVIKVLAPGFSNKLVQLEQGDLKKSDRASSKIGLSGILSRIVTRTPNEAALFNVIWKIAGRDRKFKQMIYPLLGSVIVFFGVMMYSQFKYITSGDGGKYYLMFLYFPVFYLYIICTNIKFSDNYKSSWIYLAKPINTPGEIFSASLKAISIKLFVPIYLICNGMFVYFYGVGFILEIVAALLLIYICLCCMLLLFKFDLPFTVDPANRANNANMLTTMVLLPISAAIAGIHYLALYFHANFFIIIPVLGAVCWFLFRKIRFAGWERIEAFQV